MQFKHPSLPSCFPLKNLLVTNMRKIEKEMLIAIENKKDFLKDNTRVVYLPRVDTRTHSRLETSRVYLYGHHIATVIHDDRSDKTLSINRTTLMQYPTMTTKSRLRSLGAEIQTRKNAIYLNGKPLMEME